MPIPIALLKMKVLINPLLLRHIGRRSLLSVILALKYTLLCFLELLQLVHELLAVVVRFHDRFYIFHDDTAVVGVIVLVLLFVDALGVIRNVFRSLTRLDEIPLYWKTVQFV